MFHDAIKNVYPDINVISSIWMGYFPTLPPPGTVQDLHDYLSVADMVGKFGGYDHADRNYPVLVGEYAAIYDDQHQNPNQLNNPTLQSAMAEAVYFLGLERNADLIIGICHGALIKNLLHEPGNVAMMKHSATEIVFSYSYYAAKMFANNYGSETVPITSDSNFGPLYWAGTKDASPSGKYYLKIVNFDGASSTPVTVTIADKSSPAKLITLSGPDKYSTNTLGSVTSVWTETTIYSKNGTYNFTLSGEYASAVLIV